MRTLRRLRTLLLSLVGAVVALLAVVYGWSQYRIGRTYDVNPMPVAVPDDPETIAHGRHVATIRGCLYCHGEGMGGKMFMDAMPVARLWASNLTGGAGGVAASYRTDPDWVRAIRDGVAPDGSPLLFMPSHEYRALGPRDLGALVGWIKSLPPIANEGPSQAVGPVGRALFLAGLLPLVPAERIDHDDRTFQQPSSGPTVAFGEYVAGACAGCHGERLTGGRVPGNDPSWPEAANLTPDPETGLGGWSETDFRSFLATGRTPDGRSVDAGAMPWAYLGRMTDTEVAALWAYLRSLPPRAKGTG